MFHSLYVTCSTSASPSVFFRTQERLYSKESLAKKKKRAIRVRWEKRGKTKRSHAKITRARSSFFYPFAWNRRAAERKEHYLNLQSLSIRIGLLCSKICPWDFLPEKRRQIFLPRITFISESNQWKSSVLCNVVYCSSNFKKLNLARVILAWLRFVFPRFSHRTRIARFFFFAKLSFEYNIFIREIEVLFAAWKRRLQKAPRFHV